MILVCCKCGHRTWKFVCPKCQHKLCSSCKEVLKKSRAKLMPRAIAAGERFARRAEKLPYFKSATDAYMRGWMAGYRAHRNDVSPLPDPPPIRNSYRYAD
jgi:transcription elongation factor Elf1